MPYHAFRDAGISRLRENEGLRDILNPILGSFLIHCETPFLKFRIWRTVRGAATFSNRQCQGIEQRALCVWYPFGFPVRCFVTATFRVCLWDGENRQVFVVRVAVFAEGAAAEQANILVADVRADAPVAKIQESLEASTISTSASSFMPKLSGFKLARS